jgi:hypothetical protein
MLRRFLLALIAVAFTAGSMAPGEAAAGGMECEQISLQAPVSGCGGEGMGGGACALACHAGACIAPTLAQPEPAVNAARPCARRAGQACDSGQAPDTAPPKSFIA